MIMLVLEPVLLTLLCTTPGKALFGMRIRDAQGKKLSIPQGYVRIMRIMSRGCGYVIIPVYNFVRVFKACNTCQVEGATEWDADMDYSFRGKFNVQVVLCIVAVALIAVLMTGIYFSSDMPKHSAPLTAAQLEDNLDRYWDFHETAWNTKLFYTVNLQFYEISAGYISERMDPPEVVYDTENGVIPGVSFEFTEVSRTVLMALPV